MHFTPRLEHVLQRTALQLGAPLFDLQRSAPWKVSSKKAALICSRLCSLSPEEGRLALHTPALSRYLLIGSTNAPEPAARCRATQRCGGEGTGGWSLLILAQSTGREKCRQVDTFAHITPSQFETLESPVPMPPARDAPPHHSPEGSGQARAPPPGPRACAPDPRARGCRSLPMPVAA